MPWNFSCREDSTSYDLQIGPSSGLEPVFQRALNGGFMAHTTDPATVLVKPLEPISAPLKGTLLTQEQYYSLLSWWQKTRRVRITDLQGRVWTVLIVEYDPQRARVASHPWKHVWTMTVDVLQVLLPGIDGGDPTIEPSPYLTWASTEGTWDDHTETWTEATA